MGECINLRRGGKAKVLPILNANLPADVTVEYNGNATFKIEIAEHGYPEEYTYQWYLDGGVLSGGNDTSYTFIGLNYGGTYKVRCDVTSKAGTVQSRTATLTVGSALPDYTFSGTHERIDDGNGNWRIKFTSSGTLRFTNRGTGINGIDVFCVGGGGGGYNNGWGGAGGGGGYTTTATGKSIAKNTDYWIDVGSGGYVNGRGGTSKFGALSVQAEGGYAPSAYSTRTEYRGASGGSGGGGFYVGGGSDGSDGQPNYTNGEYVSGSGQHRTTREFGESGATLYAGGGAGGSDSSNIVTTYGGAGGGGNSGYRKNATQGTNGLGGGGGGGCSGSYAAAGGGSGIVIIRNKR